VVATILSLRFVSMRHLLMREKWRQIILGAAVLWMLTLIPQVLWGYSALTRAEPTARNAALVTLGVFFALGWALVPVLIAGVDDTLDPRRFAPIGVKADRIMPGLLVAALITLPALFFTALWLTLSASWFASGPVTGAIAILGALIQTVSLVALGRLGASWAERIFANRLARNIAFAVSFFAIIAFAYFAWQTLAQGLESLFEADFDVAIGALEDTPLVSALAAAHAAEQGHWAVVAWRLGIALVWTGVLLLAWRANVVHALVTPLHRSGGTGPRTDTVVRAGRRMILLAPSDRVGPAGAVFARAARAWRSDPRYITGLTAVVLLPVVFVTVIVPVFDLDPRWTFAAPFVLATSVGWGRHNDVAYDSSALWLDIVAGRRGGDVMRGRFAAVLAWSLPLVMIGSLVVVGWAGYWSLAPAVVGTAVGALGTSLGIAAITSVVLPYRTPAPGENPFGAEVGSVGAGLLGQIVSSVATFAILPFVIVPCVLAVAVDARWGIVAAIGGLGFGVAGYVFGLLFAGRLYDARAGKLLAAVR